MVKIKLRELHYTCCAFFVTNRLWRKTPLLRWRINPFGRYHFDLARMRQDSGQLVELPSELSA
jgi:hypothetical protein